MGIPLKSYFLYSIDSKYLLIRALQPGYSNSNQNKADKYLEILKNKGNRLLEYYIVNKDSKVEFFR